MQKFVIKNRLLWFRCLKYLVLAMERAHFPFTAYIRFAHAYISKMGVTTNYRWSWFDGEGSELSKMLEGTGFNYVILE